MWPLWRNLEWLPLLFSRIDADRIAWMREMEPHDYGSTE